MKDDLIARLEAASEGSEALDAAIVVAINWRPKWCATARGELWVDDSNPDLIAVRLNTTGRKSRGQPPIGAFPEFSTSLDAALTLVPDHLSYTLTRSAAGPPTFTRCVLWDWRRSPTGSDPGNEWKSEGNRSLPLNICIAALRARSASETT